MELWLQSLFTYLLWIIILGGIFHSYRTWLNFALGQCGCLSILAIDRYMMGFMHGCVVILLVLQSMWFQPNRESLVLVFLFSGGHFLADLKSCLQHREVDLTLHHVIVIIAYAYGYVRADQPHLLWWMAWFTLFGEITNPLHQIFDMWMRTKGQEVDARKTFYKFDCVFMLAYMIVRFIFAPIFLYGLFDCSFYSTLKYTTMFEACPDLQDRCALICVVLLIEAGSFWWFIKMSRGFIRFHQTLFGSKETSKVD